MTEIALQLIDQTIAVQIGDQTIQVGVGYAPAGQKGDPGGNVMAIGLFADGASLSIPGGTNMVRTSGHTADGVGQADYVVHTEGSSSANTAYAAANPRTAFVSANGRLFRLAQKGFVEVLQLGALGGGIVDDRAAINATIAYAQSFPVPLAVYLPGSRYRITGSLLPTKGISLFGDGPTASVLTLTDDFDAIYADMVSVSEHGLRIWGLGIERTGATATAGAAILLRNAFSFAIFDVKTQGTHKGIHAINSGLGTIDRLHVADCVYSGLHYDLEDLTTQANFNIRAANSTLSGGQFSVYAYGRAEFMTFDTVTMSSASYCAVYTNSNIFTINRRPAYWRFAKCDMDGCARGVDLAYALDFEFEKGFVSCRPESGAIIGVRGPAQEISFRGTKFFLNGKKAVVLGAGSSHVNLLACKIGNNSYFEPMQHPNILADTGCGPFTIESCIESRDFDVATAVSTFFLQVAAIGSTDYSFRGNDLTEGSGARFTASVTSGGTTLTVTTIDEGYVRLGDRITGPGIAGAVTIAGNVTTGGGTGSGATGTYTLSPAASSTASGDYSTVWGTGQVLDERMGAGRRVGDNLGYRTATDGAGVLSSGTSTVTVKHMLAETPTAANIRVMPSSPLPAGTMLYVSAVTARTFTLTLAQYTSSGPTPTTIPFAFTFAWRAALPGN